MQLVSIIIPYDFDRGWLDDAIKSAQNQTYRDIEVITAHSSGNCSTNINLGFKQSSGDYIKILAEDDLLPKTAVQDLVGGIQGYDWVYADARGFGDIACFYRGQFARWDRMLEHNRIHGGAVLYRRRCFEETGGFDELLDTGEEYEFHLRLMRDGYKHRYINKTVYLYREHEMQKSRTITSKERIKRHAYIQKIRERFN